MKRILAISFAFFLVSCALVGNPTPTETPIPTTTVTTISPTLTNTLTLTPSPTKTPAPTITQLPPAIMKDIFLQEHIYGGQITQDGINSENFDFEISTDSDCIHSGIYGLRLTGNGNDKDKSYWSIVFSENPFVVKKRLLSFWVKGKFGRETFTIDIEGNQDPMIENSEQYVNVSASEWHLVNIPLNSMFIFSIKFYFTGSENRNICIDDISFPQ